MNAQLANIINSITDQSVELIVDIFVTIQSKFGTGFLCEIGSRYVFGLRKS